jgi:hypothetical protein
MSDTTGRKDRIGSGYHPMKLLTGGAFLYAMMTLGSNNPMMEPNLASTTPKQPTNSSNRTSFDVTPPPLLAARKFYAAGFDARHGVNATNHSHYWRWTEDTDKAFKEVWDNAMNPPSCSNDTTFLKVQRQNWGLGSRIRDTMDVLLGALNLESAVIHEGSNICPSEEANDPFMLCLFEPFSACQGKLISTEGGKQRYNPGAWEAFAFEAWHAHIHA